MTGPGAPAVLRAFAQPKGALAGGWLVLLVVLALAAPWIAPHDYAAQNPRAAYLPPGSGHWLGTDEFGRDVLSRLIWGARTSLGVATVAIGLSLSLGLALGAAAAWVGGMLDRAVTILVDFTWSFPEILVALMLLAILGPGTTGVMAAIGVAYLAQFTRLTRAQVMALRTETYVEAARSMGASGTQILARHLLPNALPPVLVAGMLAAGDAIILEATLGYFGLGAQPPVPSWGGMMSSGTLQLFRAPWVIVLPGLAIAITVLAINLYGDAVLRELDRHARRRTA